MLEHLAAGGAGGGNAGRALAIIGAIVWGLVEVTVPGSMPNLLLRHMLKASFTFGLFGFAAGVLLGLDQVRWFGAGVIGVTAAAWLTVRAVAALAARLHARRLSADAGDPGAPSEP